MRKLARELVYKLVFSYSFTKEKNEETMNLFFYDISLDDSDKEYIKKTYFGCMDYYDEILKIIEDNVTNFALDRIYRPDLICIVLATYEFKFGDVDISLAVNEAVELAKKYGTSKSSGFVNGVLAKIAK